MIVMLFFSEEVLRLICEYAPRSVRSLEEKQSFYDELKGERGAHSAGDFVMHLSGVSGHGRHIDGLDGVHGVYGVGHRNLEGRMSLEFCLWEELCVSSA